MASDSDRRSLAVRPSSTSYEVGYCKPPVHTRFQPGQSGNPRGRPKGSRKKPSPPALNEERLKAIVLDEAYRMINVNDVSGQVTIPMAQAVIRSLAVNAAKGNQRAQRLFTELLTTVERENKQLHDEWLETAITYKVEWERELRRRQALGIDAPDPVPHPDHIIIDMSTGRVRITGPMTREEQLEWDRLRERKSECDSEIADLQTMLEDPDNAGIQHLIRQDIEHERKLRDMIAKVIPD